MKNYLFVAFVLNSFCNNVKDSSVTFDQINISLLNKRISYNKNNKRQSIYDKYIEHN